MQNKKSVVFITPENMLPLARSVKKPLISDNRFAGIVISEKKLRCLVKNAFFDKFFPEGSGSRRLFKKCKKKIHKRNPENMTYGDWCGLPQKTVRNLLYRFVPDVVVVSTEEALRSILVERKKTGVKCSVCVMFGDKAQDELIDEQVEFYFVEDLTERNALIANGVPAEKIVMGIAVLSEQKSREDLRNEAKSSLGITKQAILFLVEKADEDEQEQISVLPGTVNETKEALFICDDQETAGLIISAGGRVLGPDDEDKAITAADLIVATKEGTLSKRAREKKATVNILPVDDSVSEYVESLLAQIKPDASKKPKIGAAYADCLKNLLEEKLNAEPIEQEEPEEEEWTVEKDDDDEE